jgi:phytoene dehydrogenase-like protein
MGYAAPRSIDAVVIGAGHNGLVAAGYLARAGLRPLVLERREEPGGALPLALTVGRLRASVIRDLRLAEHGLALVRPEVRVFAPQPDGRAVTLWADPARTSDELRAWSAKDAFVYPAVERKFRALSSFLAYLNAATPPDIRSPSLADALAGLRLGRALRGLGSSTHAREVLRILPMAVADLVAEAFETDALRGAVATRGVRYQAMGPWSAGTAAALLLDSAGNQGGVPGETVFARGGSAAVARALLAAAQELGAVVRMGADVVSIRSHDGRATGVALASGEEIDAHVVVSSADPKRTLVGMVDPVELGPTLRWRAGNLRLPGVVARVELQLSALPRFPGAADEEQRLRGRIVIAPGIDYLERAFDASKYGRISEEPYIEAVIPTLVDPGDDGHHTVNVLVQWAPYHLRGEDWTALRQSLGDLAVRTLETYAPGISDLVTERDVITPLDLEREYGLTEGHPLHGEHALDQFFLWRPLLGHARYRMPLAGLYLCGSGAHPGGGVTGAPGANAAREIIADLRKLRWRG